MDKLMLFVRGIRIFIKILLFITFIGNKELLLC